MSTSAYVEALLDGDEPELCPFLATLARLVAIHETVAATEVITSEQLRELKLLVVQLAQAARPAESTTGAPVSGQAVQGQKFPSVKLTEGKKMLPPNEFDAELHDWIIVMHPTAFMTCPTIVGTVRYDKTGRFADGRTIRTSALLTPIEQIQPGAIVQTLNTRYLLIGPPARQN